MSEVLDCLSLEAIRDFMERDTNRILGTFPNDSSAKGRELVLFTERMCVSISFEALKKGYIKLWERFGEQNNLSNLICKKVELIMGGENCGISGNTAQFKLTFVKI